MKVKFRAVIREHGKKDQYYITIPVDIIRNLAIPKNSMAEFVMETDIDNVLKKTKFFKAIVKSTDESGNVVIERMSVTQYDIESAIEILTKYHGIDNIIIVVEDEYWKDNYYDRSSLSIINEIKNKISYGVIEGYLNKQLAEEMCGK